MKPWEIHPALVHFPIAFLLAGAVLDLYAARRPREGMTRSAAGLMLAGVVLGWAAAAAGVVAFFTAPHSDEVHDLMYWHPAFAILALVIFTVIAILRWRRRAAPARHLEGALSAIAAILLVVAAWLGGSLVFRGSAGVSRETAAPEEHKHEHHH